MTINQDRLRMRAYHISLLVSLLLLALKFYAFRITQSQAILSDAIESIVNVIMPIIGIAVLAVAHRPADREHPYGHGKLEYFSSAIEGTMIFAAAAMIFVEAIKALLRGTTVNQLDLGLLYIVIAAAVNLALGFFVKKTGEKFQSIALVANGTHILSDVWTTVGVLIGLGLVRLTGLNWLDPVSAMAVGASLAWQGFKIIREAAGGLLDEEDESLIGEIARHFTKNRTSGIIHIHHARIIRSGRYHHIDAHVVVPEFWDVTTAHEETERFERAVIKDYSVDGEIHFHLDPCRKAYCQACDLQDCSVRKAKFEAHLPFTEDSLVSPDEPESYR